MCSKCLNVHYDYFVFLLFKCLTKSALLVNGFENYRSQIENTYYNLNQKLEKKIIELKPTPQEIDFTNEIPESSGNESRCCNRTIIVSSTILVIAVIVFLIVNSFSN